MKQHEADHIKMCVPARAEYVGVVRLTASGIANRQGFTYEEIEDIKVAVAEGCTNVVSHAYAGEGMMDVSFLLFPNRIEVVISDQGEGIDIDKVKGFLGPIETEKPISDLKEGGLGLFLIDALMDKVEIHNESGVVLKMTKFLKRDEVDKDGEGVSSKRLEQPADLRMD